MDSNQVKSMLQAGQSALFMDGKKLMYTDGDFFADVNGFAKMFASRNWSETDIVGQRFADAEQASGVPFNEIQETLEASEIFIYTPATRGRREEK